MDNKKLPVVIAVVVVAVLALLWSMKSSFGGGERAPTGPPKAAIEEYQKQDKGGR